MILSRRELLTTGAAITLAGGLPAATIAANNQPKKLVLIAGTPSHGPGDHEFNAGIRLLAKCLHGVPNLETVVFLNGYPKDDSALDTADAIVCYADGGNGHPLIRDKRLERIGQLMAKGVGLMCMHYGVEVPKDLGGPQFQEWIGGYYEHAYSVNPMWTPQFQEFPHHPVCRGVQPLSIRDEWYFNIRFREKMKGITPILVAKPSDAVRDGPYVYPRGPYKHIQEAKGRDEVMMWVVERDDGGRGCGFTGGHTHRNWKDDNFRKVVLNAMVWLCKLEVPARGVQSTVTDEEIAANWDDKGKKK